MAYRALDVANYVVHRALETGQPITHLQLQKILYYLEANSLVKNGEMLFEDDIEKWRLGPVVPKVYHQYKIFGSEPISYIPEELVIDEESLNVFLKNFNPESIKEQTKHIIDPIIDKLLQYNGPFLVDQTHKHEIWLEDADRINSGEKGIKYDKKQIKKYFEKHPQMLEILK